MSHLAMIGMARDIGFCVDEYLCEFAIQLVLCLNRNALCVACGILSVIVTLMYMFHVWCISF